jgi:hypothetical protein
MKYKVRNGIGKKQIPRGMRALRSVFFLLLTSYFLLQELPASAQQPNNPSPNPDCGGPSITSTPTNAGMLFMLCFEENIDPYFESTYSSGSYTEIYFSSLGQTDTVTITCNRYPDMNKVFFLPPNSSMSYDVSDDTLHESLGLIDTMHDLWVVSDETIDNRVVQVQATSPIVCYGLDYKRYSADAFCALPEEYSGTEYSILSYPSSTEGVEGNSTSSQFAVAAFQDNTIVTITPAALTLNRSAGGIPETFTLQKGQCVQIQADTLGVKSPIPHLDLTGSTVRANNPVAVYGGHVETEIPDGYYRPSDQYVTRDMLLETMPPTSTWGQNFVLDAVVLDSTGAIGPDGDLMRVLAIDSNTVVFVNGKPWDTLISKRNPKFSDTLSITGPTLVSSSEPLLVGEFEHSAYTYAGNGDPFLAIVPPVDQTNDSYTFSLASDTNFRYQSVTIVADTNCQRSITLDGNLIPAGKFTLVPGVANGRTFSICEYGLPQGTHTISTPAPPEQGFTILAYGLGFANAYGYAAGELLIPKRAIRIDYPPQSIGLGHSNTLSFHNTAYQPAYLDSAIFIPGNPNATAFDIHVEENVGLDIGRVDVGGMGQIHLVSDHPLSDPVSGTVKIYSHLPSYFNIEPAESTFTLYPNAAADVDIAAGIVLIAKAAPNPFSSFTTINFSVPESVGSMSDHAGNAADITMILYDELGRVVQHIASSEFSPGSYSIRIERHGLANGVYVCEISSNKLNLRERIPLIAGE